MKPVSILAVLALVTWLDSSALAQSRTFTCGPFTTVVTPYPAPRGVPISMAITNTSSNPIAFGCTGIVEAIAQGSPQGPWVRNFGCSTAGHMMQPGQQVNTTWSQVGDGNVPAAAGDYYALIHPVIQSACSIPLRIEDCRNGSFQRFGTTCSPAPCFIPWATGPEVHVGGCPEIGTTLRFHGSQLACGSQPMNIALLLGTSRTAWNGLALPLGLPGGCSLRTSVEVQAVRPTAAGMGTFEVPIPGLPALRGATVHAQLLQLSPTTGLPLTTNGVSVSLY